VILDLVLASSKDRGLRDEVYEYARESRLGVEAAWLEVRVRPWCTGGQGGKSPVADHQRGAWLFGARAVAARRENCYARCSMIWKVILYGHLKGLKESS